MQSRLLQDALSDFAQEAADVLQAQLQAGAEIPFELAGGGWGRRGMPGLQLYSPMTGAFVAQRWAQLCRLPSHGRALRALRDFRGLDRYLGALDLGSGMRCPDGGGAAARALQAFVQEVFAEQSDFVLRDERLQAALRRISAAATVEPGSLRLVASLHGLAIISEQVQLAQRLTISRPQALSGVPEQVRWPWREGASASVDGAEHLLVVLDVPEQERVEQTLAYGKELLGELLRALRLYGDGRIALSPLAWACAGDGPFAPVALGQGGHPPQGVLVVCVEQEDELRAFCSLLARRMPREGSLAFALRRFEIGCERAGELEGLSDHLLALQALLEPERMAHGLLATRVAALCAPVESRQHVAARVLRAVELERDFARGEAVQSAAAVELARELAGYLRALLRDAICGHLAPDLIALADAVAIQCSEQPPPGSEGEKTTRIVRARRGKASASKARSQAPLPI